MVMFKPNDVIAHSNMHTVLGSTGTCNDVFRDQNKHIIRGRVGCVRGVWVGRAYGLYCCASRGCRLDRGCVGG